MEKHLNAQGNMFGGVVLAWLDEAAALYTMEKIRYTNIVTVSMDNVNFLFTELMDDDIRFTILRIFREPAGKDGTEGQLEKGVDGYPAGIDGGNTGRCNHDHPFGWPLFQAVQKSGLPGARLSSKKDVTVGELHKFKSKL